MTTSPLQIPSNPNAELFFDANALVVGYRSRRAAPEKPVRALRPKVLRVVVQCFGWVLDDRFFHPGEKITIGAGKENTFQVPTKDLPDNHELLSYRTGGTIVLTVNKHFDGVLQIQNQLTRLNSAPKKASGAIDVVEMPTGSRGFVEHGTLRIYFEEIPDPDKAPPITLWKSFSDPYFFRWLLVSIAIHLMIFLFIKLIAVIAPPPPKPTIETLPTRFKKIIVEPQKFKKYVPRIIPTKGFRGAVGQEGEGARAPGKKGRRGRGIPGRKGKRVHTPDITRRGVLDVFRRSGKGSALDELLGGVSGSALPGSVDKAFDRTARYGLQGEREIREGKGLRGTGTGGGGLSTSIGQGLGTKGRGGGRRGPGLADFGTGRSDIAVSASIDEEEVFITGSIPRETIARIMNDHMGQIRFCYQREVNVNPDLRGKVVVDFIIGLKGRVITTRIKKSTLANSNVEKCIQNVIRRIPFPRPGGGTVEVIYPFVFRLMG